MSAIASFPSTVMNSHQLVAPPLLSFSLVLQDDQQAHIHTGTNGGTNTLVLGSVKVEFHYSMMKYVSSSVSSGDPDTYCTLTRP